LRKVLHYEHVLDTKRVQSAALRFLEWRARRVPDPVARLQFLQRQIVAVSLPAGRKHALFHTRIPAICLGLALLGAALPRPWASQRNPQRPTQPHVIARQASYPAASVSSVWLVESTERSDLYSNGLRVENRFAAETAPRAYLAFARSLTSGRHDEWSTRPAGIVFHTTESHIVPFEEEQNRELRRDGEGLLEYVSRKRSYHFVIDRFGQVFRIVKENDYANHAGNSVWADDERIYVSLNQSFFGVAFEARNSAAGGEIPVNPAQIHAARILVEMLRARYSIRAENCVAHGQVSVNPDNGRAGYHIDWIANLPFRELGLTNNYTRPLASIVLFGFEPDSALAESSALAEAIEHAQRVLQKDAATQELTPARYRVALQARYRELIERQRHGDAGARIP
jgi:N-acetylmuramoyl-L-alanine amidase